MIRVTLFLLMILILPSLDSTAQETAIVEFHPKLDTDTVRIQFKMSDFQKAEWLYLTFGYIDSVKCQLFRYTIKFQKDSIGVFLQPMKAGAKGGYFDSSGIAEIKIPLGDRSLNFLNYAMVNASDIEGVYTEMSFYGDSQNLNNLPCVE